MKQVLFVGLGGAAGSMLRYLTNVITLKYYSANFPLATFIVNVAGCFIAGLIFGSITQETAEAQNLKVLLITGFCGGFTTFSAFALENVRLMNSGNLSTAVLYTGLSIVAGLLAAWLGLSVVR
ncbi:MAG TPA: fluoride efflux transporter CrcB [Cyclobacteriaceae bacterium]|nr:fluoride efflux transporter CrcB [Cyclobacteriaceae bacterium]HMV10652.1 fluoride efflux transporter CrcB [Cyclobacteriaceae bacterium]HMV91554.1 fluoride efflux transporter CrcB [Cyclobacteriaceae bacterium]HMX02513.1 fluoride efflux transporter CrcB [Cyclobacteriaceae bacterium]HMX52241.1 fluoride efflux transporter CrcB [Cyclobacteriaceae bacterium]